MIREIIYNMLWFKNRTKLTSDTITRELGRVWHEDLERVRLPFAWTLVQGASPRLCMAGWGQDSHSSQDSCLLPQ